MRTLGVVVVAVLGVLASPARADDVVNLLTSAPSTIAVSSTVDNVTIRPEHIADGKLDTAWNSATAGRSARLPRRVAGAVEGRLPRDQGMEGGSSDECELVAPTVGAKLPKRLELSCHSTDEDWHNDDIDKRGMNEQERTDHLTWNGSRYQNP